MTASRVAVAGAGYLGRRVIDALSRRNIDAIALGRSEQPDLRSMHVDLDDDTGDAVRIDGAYSLLYTVPPPGTGNDDPRLRNLLNRLEPAPSRLVLISTTGVYGDRGGLRVSEDDPVRPESERAKRRVAAEGIAAEFCKEKGCALAILRVPGIYGPGRLGLERLVDGAEVLRDEDSGPGNRIHVDDLARCCLAALDDAAAPGIYNAGDGDYRPSASFSADIARLAGLPMPTPISLADARKRWSPMRLSFATESRRVDTTKMREVLGVTPKYADPLDGIRASLAEEAAASD